METLTGKKTLTLPTDSSESLAVEVSQIKLKDYGQAFAVVDDEMKLVAFAVGLTLAQLCSLTPESYEIARQEVYEMNAKGFFVYAARRQAVVLERISKVSPEILRIAAEKASSPTPLGLLPK